MRRAWISDTLLTRGSHAWLREIDVATTSLCKIVRFVSIYGLVRTIFKAVRRLGIVLPLWSVARLWGDIGVIGCGQFAFSTIAYFLWARFGNRIAACYDTDATASGLLAKTFRV